MRTNSVYDERDMQLAADLQGEYLSDSARLETIKTLLVFQVAGLAEPATMAELKLVKVTFEKYLHDPVSPKCVCACVCVYTYVVHYMYIYIYHIHV